MTHEQGGEQTPAPVVTGEAFGDSNDLLRSVQRPGGSGAPESIVTVLVAFAINILIAVAKSVAAAVTGSASMLAEAAHSWADAGNEVFLLVADRRSRRPARRRPPVRPWPGGVRVVAARRGRAVRGRRRDLGRTRHPGAHPPEPASNFAVGYVVLGISFVLEAISFLQSLRQARPEAEAMQRDLIEHVLVTSDPTLRAVFFEDTAALIGLVIATAGLAAHELTGSAIPDAIGSILIGVLLGLVAIDLINRNRRFLIGQEADPRVRAAAIQALTAEPEVARVTYLRLEIVGPRKVSVIGYVNLTGDDNESQLARRLRALEAKISQSPAVAGAVLSLSSPDEPTITG